MKIKQDELTWLKLDNAALIYPATLSRKQAAMFRLTVTLNDKVDIDILSKAIENIMPRFPTFNFTLKEGLFWFYFDPIDDRPKIDGDYQNPLLRICFKENKNYLFRVRLYGSRIAVEFFHALTDGTGGLTFLLTLTGEYLKIKYGINVEYNNLVLNPKEEACKEEIEDSFLRYARGKGGLEHEKKAYHMTGVMENYNILNIITGIVSVSKLKTITKKYKATITEFLVSLMILCIEEISQKEIKQNKKPIKVSVPINLRNIYKTKTLRNFSSYVNVGIEATKESHTLDEILKNVKKQLKEKTREKNINAKISGNVNMAKNIFVRIVPMFIKKRIMALFESVMGDGYITTTLSNIGLVYVPLEMQKYITDMNFILGRSRGKSTSVSAIGYGDKLYISFSRKIKEAEFERLFFTKLVKMGLMVEIESNR